MKLRVTHIILVVIWMVGSSSCGTVKKHFGRSKTKVTIDSVDQSVIKSNTVEITKGDSVVTLPEDSLISKVVLDREDTVVTETVESGNLLLTVFAKRKKNGNTEIDVKAKRKKKTLKPNYTKVKTTKTDTKKDVKVTTQKKEKTIERKVQKDKRWGNFTIVCIVAGLFILIYFLITIFKPKFLNRI